MKPTHWCFALTAAGLANVACSTREGTLAPEPNEDAGATSAGGTGTGTGGAGGAATGTAGTTTTTSTSGPECAALGAQDTCAVGDKCTVVDSATGALGCTPAGSTADYSPCAVNADCGVGAWCDDETGVCKQVCRSAQDCEEAGLGLCIEARAGANLIPGLRLCTAHCHPVFLSPCGVGVSCVHPGTPNDFDCHVSNGAAAMTVCAESYDCAPGLVCAPDGFCSDWCHAADVGYCCGNCLLGICEPCQNLSPSLSYEGEIIPACWGSASC